MRLIIAAFALLPSTAFAHLGLMEPPSRYGASVLKDGPCGVTGGTRSANVTTLRPGETITIVFDEYTDHPGHFRVAFDDDGDDDFADPPCLSGCDCNGSATGCDPEYARYSDPTVLLDGIPDRRARPGDDIYSVEVTLPDVTCDNCTLQVIQVMYDKPPHVSPGNDMYYQCADLVLAGEPMPAVDAGPRADAGPPPPGRDAGATTTPPMVDGGCGCVTAGAPAPSSAAPWFALGLVGIALRRRRRGASVLRSARQARRLRTGGVLGDRAHPQQSLT